MRRLKFAAMFISCLMLVSGWLAPMSKAALEALAPDDSGAAPYSGTGLAPAGSACGARPSGGGARTDGREVMLC